jgi:monoamine oxidase
VLRTQTALWRALTRALSPFSDAFEAAEQNWNSETAARIAARSFAEIVDRDSVPNQLRQAAIAFRGFYLADPSDVSALVVVEQALADGNPGAVKMFRIRGGNDRLIEALVRSVGRDRIDIGHDVKRLVHDQHGVRVTIRDAHGRSHEYHASYAVITAPAPLVRSIEFEPPLPEPKQRALELLTYGCATKLLLRFDRAWWRRRGRPNAYGTDLPVGAVWDSAEEQKGAALLTLLAGGSASATSRDLLAQEGVAGILDRLRWLGSPGEPLAEPWVVTWEDDQWARGGYACFTPRFEPSFRDWLPRAWGRLLFAGEHTSEKSQGYMNGAVESGLRAAREVESLQRLAEWDRR